jgi:hypothetical protein
MLFDIRSVQAITVPKKQACRWLSKYSNKWPKQADAEIFRRIAQNQLSLSKTWLKKVKHLPNQHRGQ